MRRTCTLDGCGAPHSARGWCSKHYARYVRKGSTEDLPPTPVGCLADGCARRHVACGYCDTHYRRWKRGVPLDQERHRRGTCAVSECERPHYARSFCRRHYEIRARALAPRCGYGFGEGPFGLGAFGDEDTACKRPAAHDGLCQAHARWARRRARHDTLGAEVESWGMQASIPLDEFVAWHKRR